MPLIFATITCPIIEEIIGGMSKTKVIGLVVVLIIGMIYAGYVIRKGNDILHNLENKMNERIEFYEDIENCGDSN